MRSQTWGHCSLVLYCLVVLNLLSHATGTSCLNCFRLYQSSSELSCTVAARTLYVSKLGASGANCGGISAPCRSLLVALNQSLDGDEIQVAGSTAAYECESPLIIKHKITIISFKSDGNGVVMNPCTSGSLAVVEPAAHLTLVGVTVTVADPVPDPSANVSSVLEAINASLSIIDCKIDVRAPLSSPVIKARDSEILVSGSSFSSSVSPERLPVTGAAMSLSYTGQIDGKWDFVVSKSSFNNFRSSSMGGAIAVQSTASPSLGRLEISDCTFANNQVQGDSSGAQSSLLGGAVSIKLEGPSFEHVWIENNKLTKNFLQVNQGGTGQGGALYVEVSASKSPPKLNVTRNEFDGNQIVNDHGSSPICEGCYVAGAGLALAFKDLSDSELSLNIIGNSLSENFVIESGVSGSSGAFGGGFFLSIANGSAGASLRVNQNVFSENRVQFAHRQDLESAKGAAQSPSAVVRVCGGGAAIQLLSLDSSTVSLSMNGNEWTKNHVELANNVRGQICGGGLSIHGTSTKPEQMAVGLSQNLFKANSIAATQNSGTIMGGGVYIDSVISPAGSDNAQTRGMALSLVGNTMTDNILQASYVGDDVFAADISEAYLLPRVAGAGMGLQATTQGTVEMKENAIRNNRVDASGAYVAVTGGGLAAILLPSGTSLKGNTSSSTVPSASNTGQRFSLSSAENYLKNNSVSWLMSYSYDSAAVTTKHPAVGNLFPTVAGGGFFVDFSALSSLQDVQLKLQSDRVISNRAWGAVASSSNVRSFLSQGGGGCIVGPSTGTSAQGLGSGSMYPLTLRNMTFLANAATNANDTSDMRGVGGGLSIFGTSILLTESSLIENYATAEGGGLCLREHMENDAGHGITQGQSEGSVVRDVLFDLNVAGAEGMQAFAELKSGLSLTGVTSSYSRQLRLSELQLAPRPRQFSVISAVVRGRLALDGNSKASCPPGFSAKTYLTKTFELSTNSSGSGLQAQEVTRLQTECNGCAVGTYSLEQVELELTKEREEKLLSCVTCPDGGNCSFGGGTVLSAGRNMWGYVNKEEHRVRFYDCPMGYCCTSDQGDCEMDSCSYHRKGPLCSACEEGYTAALFSSACMSDDTCAAQSLLAIFFLFLSLAALWIVLLVLQGRDKNGAIEIFVFFFQLMALTVPPSQFRFSPVVGQIISFFMFGATPLTAPPAGRPLCIARDMSSSAVLWVYLCFPVLLAGLLGLGFLLEAIGNRVLRVIGRSRSGGTSQLQASPVPVAELSLRDPPPLMRKKLELLKPVTESQEALETTPQPSRSTAFQRAVMKLLPCSLTVIFYISLTLVDCVRVGGIAFLYWDSEVSCLQWWQPLLQIFTAVCVLITLLPLASFCHDRLRSLYLPHGVFRAVNRLQAHLKLQQIAEVLASPYKAGFHYWQSVLCAHRLLSCLVLVYVKNVTLASVMNASLALLFLLLHTVAQPFSSPSVNHLQTVLLGALLLVAMVSGPGGAEGVIDAAFALSDGFAITTIIIAYGAFTVFLLLVATLVLEMVGVDKQVLSRRCQRYDDSFESGSFMASGAEQTPYAELASNTAVQLSVREFEALAGAHEARRETQSRGRRSVALACS